MAVSRNALHAAAPFPLVPVRSWFGFFYLLPDGPRSVLIDTGLGGELGRLRRTLVAHGLGPRDIAAILLTHGHLDHTGNLARLKEETGATIFAHSADQAHIEGAFEYRGWARVCGAAEAIGRFALGYRSARIDQPIADGDELLFWGGLRVVHLPGHTAGHCGFYSVKHRLLFSGDLFASYRFSVHRPPRVLNSEPGRLPESLRKAAEIGATFVVPNHTFSTDWRRHADRLKLLSYSG